ncbi:MAG: GNAT family N-acetyltransferase [Phycisphaeraceae bacterium]
MKGPGTGEIRVGEVADFDAIDAFDPLGGNRREELASGRVLVVEVGGELVGYVTYSAAGFIGRPFIHFLAIAERYRRHGLARRLLGAIADRVGPCRLFVSTEADNEPMLRLLDQDQWIAAGCVEGVNLDGPAECFFYRDVDEAAGDQG